MFLKWWPKPILLVQLSDQIVDVNELVNKYWFGRPDGKQHAKGCNCSLAPDAIAEAEAFFGRLKKTFPKTGSKTQIQDI